MNVYSLLRAIFAKSKRPWLSRTPTAQVPQSECACFEARDAGL